MLSFPVKEAPQKGQCSSIIHCVPCKIQLSIATESDEFM